MSNPGKTVRLFLVDGTPGGLLTAEIMNWTGHVIAAPRSDLASLVKRQETSRTGIYILLGDDPDSLGGTRTYIGEADDISKRLYQHSRAEDQGGKDFWGRVILLTSKDANLTKAHARYLESRFIDLAQRASRTHLTNGTAPPVIPLPEADKSDMEYFISQALIVLPVVGVNMFRGGSSRLSEAQNATEPGAPQPSNSPVFKLQVRKYGIAARAQEIDGEFTVLSGSLAKSEWTGVTSGYRALHEKLRQDGTLINSPVGQVLVFTHDQVFDSPSAAAAVATGRNTNGRLEWKTEHGATSFGDWQTERIDMTAKEVLP